MYVPISSGPNEPLVISLHGWGTTADFYMWFTFMEEVADTAGFIVCYPQAIDNIWNSGISDNTPNVDDVGFISSLIDTLYAEYSIDQSRVYVCGHSNGGFMTFRLVCELNDRFAKAASVAGAMTNAIIDSCGSALPMPMLLMHGTTDPVVPYSGTESWTSADETLDYWLGFI